MYYPYAFEFAVKAGLMKNGKLVEPLIEPTVTELIAAFSRVAILQLTAGMGAIEDARAFCPGSEAAQE
jgi:hypothetical protein